MKILNTKKVCSNEKLKTTKRGITLRKKKKSSSALSRRNKRPGYRFQTAEAFRQSSTHSFCLGTKPSLFPGEEKARMNRQGREGRFRMKPAADYWLPTEKRPFRTWLFSDLVAGGAVELRVTSGVLYLLSCVYFCRGQCISIRWKTVNMPSVGRVANFQAQSLGQMLKRGKRPVWRKICHKSFFDPFNSADHC